MSCVWFGSGRNKLVQLLIRSQNSSSRTTRSLQFIQGLESIMRDNVIKHLEKHKLVTGSQHGFVKNKSCLTNLLMFMAEVTNYLDSGYPVVDVIYLDFQKAFDKIPHCRLVSKLAAHGISGDLLRWTENCLSGRKQRVVLGGQEWSNILRLCSGPCFICSIHQ